MLIAFDAKFEIGFFFTILFIALTGAETTFDKTLEDFGLDFDLEIFPLIISKAWAIIPFFFIGGLIGFVLVWTGLVCTGLVCFGFDDFFFLACLFWKIETIFWTKINDLGYVLSKLFYQTKWL